MKGPSIRHSQRPALLKHPSPVPDDGLAVDGMLRIYSRFLEEPSLTQARDGDNPQAQARFGQDEKFHTRAGPGRGFVKRVVLSQGLCDALVRALPSDQHVSGCQMCCPKTLLLCYKPDTSKKYIEGTGVLCKRTKEVKLLHLFASKQTPVFLDIAVEKVTTRQKGREAFYFVT